jgi:catechol 2,3-dioxygenase-like lactoylglutathione lyase family enzyme
MSMIVRLERLGFATRSVNATRVFFRDVLGLESWAEEPDPLIGVSRAASIPFPNSCSLYLMESCDPRSSVYQYLQNKGPGLERLVLQTDSIREEEERLRLAGVEAIRLDGACQRIVVSAESMLGITIEVVQAEERLAECPKQPSGANVLGLQHVGVAVRSLDDAAGLFKRALDLETREARTDQHGGEQKDAMIEPGNDRLWLHLTESWGPHARVRQFLEEKGPGLEHICIEVRDIRDAVQRAIRRGVPIHDHKIFTNRDDGFEAFVYPEYTGGVTVELIEPFPTSRGYRANKRCPDPS